MAELLIAAVDLNTQKKGEVVDVKPTPFVWGNKEGLPNFVQLSVPDVTREQAYSYFEEWTMKYQHKIINENDEGYRIKVSADPEVINASGLSRSVIKLKMQNFLTKRGAVRITVASGSITFDIPKPVDLIRLKKEFADQYNARFDSRRYYFSATDVDNAVAQGGKITLTKQQALNIIVDKFTE